MKGILRAFRAIASLGIFGLILILCILLIGWSVFSIFNLVSAVTESYNIVQARATLAAIRYSVYDQELQEKYFETYTDDQEYLNSHNASAQSASENINTFFSDYRDISQAIATLIDELKAGQEQHIQNFDQIAASGGSTGVVQVQEENSTAMHNTIADLTINIDMALQQTNRKVTQEAKTATLSGIAILILLPLLALWAFISASQITRPILLLSNAVTAVEGSLYKPEIMSDVTERRDNIGKLARAVEQVASASKVSEERLQQEINTLREQLSEERRRKLMPTAPKKDTVEE